MTGLSLYRNFRLFSIKSRMTEEFSLARTTKSAFLMNVPFSLSTEVPNNIWMLDYSPDERVIDKDKALFQFMSMYSFVARYAIVYLLPSYPDLQDQTYVANLGIVLPHIAEQIVVISNFRSEVRRPESDIGREFLRLMNFSVIDAPEYFEGEADLKHIRDNLYVGAYGIRTSKNALDWFSNSFEMKVIPICMQDSRLYHLDCLILPVSNDKVIACTELIDKENLRELEKYVCLYDVEYNLALSGITNSIVLDNYILCSSHIAELKPSSEEYNKEKCKIEKLEDFCSKFGMELKLFNLSEFLKSGALLSCLMMHLNRNNYRLANN